MAEQTISTQIHPWIDATDAPIYRVRFPSGIENVDIGNYFEKLTALYRSFGDGAPKVGWVMDCTQLLKVTAVQRKEFADRAKRIAIYERRWVEAMGVVATTALSQGIVTAVFWFYKPGYPYRVFRDTKTAHAWVVEQLEDAPTA